MRGQDSRTQVNKGSKRGGDNHIKENRAKQLNFQLHHRSTVGVGTHAGYTGGPTAAGDAQQDVTALRAGMARTTGGACGEQGTPGTSPLPREAAIDGRLPKSDGRARV